MKGKRPWIFYVNRVSMCVCVLQTFTAHKVVIHNRILKLVGLNDYHIACNINATRLNVKVTQDT